jgi:hypothetical protein
MSSSSTTINNDSIPPIPIVGPPTTQELSPQEIQQLTVAEQHPQPITAESDNNIMFEDQDQDPTAPFEVQRSGSGRYLLPDGSEVVTANVYEGSASSDIPVARALGTDSSIASHGSTRHEPTLTVPRKNFALLIKRIVHIGLYTTITGGWTFVCAPIRRTLTIYTCQDALIKVKRLVLIHHPSTQTAQYSIRDIFFAIGTQYPKHPITCFWQGCGTWILGQGISEVVSNILQVGYQGMGIKKMDSFLVGFSISTLSSLVGSMFTAASILLTTDLPTTTTSSSSSRKFPNGLSDLIKWYITECTTESSMLLLKGMLTSVAVGQIIYTTRYFIDIWWKISTTSDTRRARQYSWQSKILQVSSLVVTPFMEKFAIRHIVASVYPNGFDPDELSSSSLRVSIGSIIKPPKVSWIQCFMNLVPFPPMLQGYGYYM